MTDNYIEIKKKVRVYLLGQMAENTMENGKQEWNME